ncbi:amidase domain-containing protein [Emergencia sp. 1XD21-10]|uniref:amidase domain-containing protein n=1 Tax=Emergencia sp. 1XD21-10 TaxID=2304569 RepID=UPI0034DD97FD
MQCVNAGDFFTYWKTRGGLVTTGLSKSQLQSKAKKGDIVQLKKDGSWYHSIIITSGTTGNWNYCGHTSNRKDKPISAITEATEYRILRFA